MSKEKSLDDQQKPTDCETGCSVQSHRRAPLKWQPEVSSCVLMMMSVLSYFNFSTDSVRTDSRSVCSSAGVRKCQQSGSSCFLPLSDGQRQSGV